MKTLSLLFTAFIVLLATSLANAKDLSGEIINVNAEQGVVFIDLGKEFVRAGDVFQVDSGDRKIFIEAVEVEAAVAKMKLSSTPDFKADPADFSKIEIGAKVTRVFVVNSTENAVAAVAVPDAQEKNSGQSCSARMQQLFDSNLKLFNSSTDLMIEKKQLLVSIDKLNVELKKTQEQNKSLEQKVKYLQDKLYKRTGNSEFLNK